MTTELATAAPRAADRRRLYLTFGALALTWGSSFLLIKVSLEGLAPPQVAAGRLLFGALALAAVAAVRRRPLPRRRSTWITLAAVAMLLCVIPFNLFAFAETRISSGLASIWNATTPLTTAVISLALLPGERLTRAKLVGLALGATGVLVVLGVWRLAGDGSDTGHADVLGQLACLGATTCYALAFVLLRRVTSGPRREEVDPVSLALVQVGIGAVVMLCLSPVVMPFTGARSVTLSAPVVAAIVTLGVLGTGVAYAWNTAVVRGLGATTAATVTYVTPVVGVLLGVLVLGEHPQWNHAVGAVLVVAGIAVGQGRVLTRRRPV